MSRITELRATAHPLRLQMLSLLTGAELSAAEVARELGITQANASYHLRFLLDAGLLVIAGEEQVRGGRAKKYRHPWDRQRPNQVARASDADKRAYVQVLADAIPRRFAERQQPGGPAHFTDADLWVSPETWEQVRDLAMQASRLIHAGARPPRTPGTIRANLSIAAFPIVTEQEDPS
ncbi:transcriptional regulator [Intrasporangium oryzae NRRL B-24470]|uniref:Transcriptional regulator n=1 Tax=Intrasporangium oryzae NRRL B-24470 TaxID=1386089 RepID=W9GA25_9MICO|nr:transcriptional regulator [Intrasporangium oryzae NRRL B-24470]